MKDEIINPMPDTPEEELLQEASIDQSEEPLEIELDAAAPAEEEKETPQEEPQSKKAALLGAMLSDGDEAVSGVRLKDILKEVSIDGQWFRRQLGLIFLIVVFIIIYITNRYQAQQEIIEQENLKIELEDWKYKAITRSSELTDKCKQSQIEEALKQKGDSTLKIANIPPYVIIKQE